MRFEGVSSQNLAESGPWPTCGRSDARDVRAERVAAPSTAGPSIHAFLSPGPTRRSIEPLRSHRARHVPCWDGGMRSLRSSPLRRVAISVAARVALPIFDEARRRDLPVRETCERHGIDLVALQAGSAWVDRRALSAVLDELGAAPGGEALGLAAAQHLRPGELGLVDVLTATCDTLREAIGMTIRVFRVFHETARPALREDGRTAWFEIEPQPAAVLSTVLAEFTVATFVELGRRALGRDLRCTEVAVSHARVPWAARLEAYFGCPVTFDGDMDGVAFPAVYLAIPLPSRDGTAQASTLRRMESAIAALPPTDGLIDDVRRCLTFQLTAGSAALERLAVACDVGPRTLQRRLARYGTSYQDMLDEVRRELALRRVSGGGVPLAEVGQNLGFTHASAFARAFRRWTGSSPSDVRSGKGLTLSGS